jgi:uncharacterized RDD family membrane protein YckC
MAAQTNIALAPHRAINYLVDQLAIQIIMFVMCPAFGLEDIAVKSIEDIAQLPLGYFALNFSVIFLYYFSLEVSSGTTVGKLLTGTYVVLGAGRNKISATIIRSLIRLIPFYPVICFFSAVILPHDRLSGTRVLRKELSSL